MITRPVRCKKCGVTFPLTYPEKLSDIGLETIRYCPTCLNTEILKHESSAKKKEEQTQ
nr:MAG TPA: zinc-ribbon protein [Caudoviricetes sp.]